jgi:phage-related protein
MELEPITIRTVRWVGDSRERLQEFPAQVRKDIGHALYLVQTGHTPPSAKPMRGMESGVFEIVDDDDTDTYRAVYTVKVGSSLYILHAFMKKSKRDIRTPKREIDLIRRRLRRAREMEAEEEGTDA